MTDERKKATFEFDGPIDYDSFGHWEPSGPTEIIEVIYAPQDVSIDFPVTVIKEGDPRPSNAVVVFPDGETYKIFIEEDVMEVLNSLFETDEDDDE